MAARWAVSDRIHGPTGLKGIAEVLRGKSVRPPKDLRAEPPDIARYLGNGYLETLARGLAQRRVWRPPRGQRGGSRRRDAWAGLQVVGNVAGKARGRRCRRRVRARGRPGRG